MVTKFTDKPIEILLLLNYGLVNFYLTPIITFINYFNSIMDSQATDEITPEEKALLEEEENSPTTHTATTPTLEMGRMNINSPKPLSRQVSLNHFKEILNKFTENLINEAPEEIKHQCKIGILDLYNLLKIEPTHENVTKIKSDVIVAKGFEQIKTTYPENVNDVTNATNQDIENEKKKLQTLEELYTKLKNSVHFNISEPEIMASDFNNLTEAREILRSLSKNLDFNQKRVNQLALSTGKALQKVQTLCKKEKRKFDDYISSLNIGWSRSYTFFLKSYYNFTIEFPRFSEVSLSIHQIMSKWSMIKTIIKEKVKLDDIESNFWKNIN